MNDMAASGLSNKVKVFRWLTVFVIVLGGAAFRLSYNAYTNIDTPIRSDAHNYLIYANNLLDHSTFSKDRNVPPAPDAYWAPGYPFYLAAIIKTSQLQGINTYNLVLFSQVLLGTAVILLTFLVANSFMPGFWPLLPTALVAVSPHLISTGSYILTEPLFSFCLLLAIYLLIAAWQHASRLLWLLAGLAFAFTYLVNPVSLFLPFLLALPLLLRKAGSQQAGYDSNRRRQGNIALLLIPVILVITGWSARTAISVADDQLSSSDRLLTNLASGLYPDYHEKWRASILKPGEKVEIPGSDITSYSKFFAALGTGLKDEPGQLLTWYTIGKPMLLWDWNIRVGWGDIYIYRVFTSLYHTSNPAMLSYSLMKSLHFWLVIASALGVFYLIRARDGSSIVPCIIYTALFYVSAVYISTQAAPRYSIPLRPEMYICAAFFIWKTSELVANARKKPTPSSARDNAPTNAR